MTGSNFRGASRDLKPSQSIKVMPGSNPLSGAQIHSDGNLRKDKNNFMLNQLYVKKWVDYSTKYGLGYLLSDGSTGVYFNDSTKMILNSNDTHVDYIERKSGQKNDTISNYPINDHPKDRQFNKKITLLQHFKNYLKTDKKEDDFVTV